MTNLNLPTEELAVIKRNYLSKRPKAIYQYDLDGKFLVEWESAYHYEKMIGKFNRHQLIGRCCRGKSPTAYGFIWRFK